MFHLITGGSGSGKSAFAEDWLVRVSRGKRIYIATMYPFDEESHARIRRHRAMRASKQFVTVERYTDLAGLSLPEGADVLLECMSNLTANEMYRQDGAGQDTVQAIRKGIDRLLAQAANLAVVTNEIFSDGIRYDDSTELYLKNLGTINQAMAARADLVTEVVYGIPVPVKVSRGMDGRKPYVAVGAEKNTAGGSRDGAKAAADREKEETA